MYKSIQTRISLREHRINILVPKSNISPLRYLDWFDGLHLKIGKREALVRWISHSLLRRLRNCKIQKWTLRWETVRLLSRPWHELKSVSEAFTNNQCIAGVVGKFTYLRDTLTETRPIKDLLTS
jgi:hypothetical protein